MAEKNQGFSAMKPYCFERTQLIPITIEQAWSFFSDPANLARITPTGHGIPHDLRSRQGSSCRNDPYVQPAPALSALNSPGRPKSPIWKNHFSLLTSSGSAPTVFWHHQHHFREVAGGVEMSDLVHYLLPHMQFSRLVNRFLVAPRLKKIFDFRQKTLQDIFPAAHT